MKETLNLSEMPDRLAREEMKAITGGQEFPGRCGWAVYPASGGAYLFGECCVTQETAIAGATYYGAQPEFVGYWCCASCMSTEYCSGQGCGWVWT